ncbi:hypothetical protein [Marichromatium sp. AB31]|uniref:hypothetical protein n=1 Tax=Marichromatium sp. AB31 TaxID=2483362 RepID=UPI000F40F940|nr:hypothetical protein [Marichromatium sp. AB31]RNE88836.1 hypothetical protein EBL84_14390 [Marichromatium sp. AB31]
MKAVDPRHVHAVIDTLTAPSAGVGALPLGASALKVRIAHSGLTREELSALSAAFLDDRRQAARGILGEAAFQAKGVEFVFLPVPGSIAALYAGAQGYTVALSLGLVEALRLSCVAGQLRSALEMLKASKRLEAAMGAEAAGKALQLLEQMIAYLIASAILAHLEARRVPNAVAALDAQMVRKANVVVEAALMFVLLHELGHVEYQRAQSRSTTTWEFAVAEELDARQEEELFADKYALDQVPAGFRLPMVHAAAFVLHLYTYIDVLRTGESRTHPLAVNRLAAMRAQVGSLQVGEVGDAATRNAIEVGQTLQAQDPLSLAGGQGLAAIEKFVATCDEVDWRPAQEALQFFSA